MGWTLAALACAWIALCTAVGPIYRADGSIADFGPPNWLILLGVFAASLGLVAKLAAIGRRRGKARQSAQAAGGAGLSGPIPAIGAGRQGWLHGRARLEAWSATSPLMRLLGRAVTRATRSWRTIMLVLLLGWAWAWITLVAAYGADLISQSREVTSWLAQLNGESLPYRQGSTIMDVYPTAHYLWPTHPTYLTDQHNLPLTLLYGGSLALSRRLTGASDLAIIILAGLQVVFATFCAAASANRFLQPAQACRLPQSSGQPDMKPAGPLARVAILLVLLVCPLIVFSTISLTKSPLFAWAFLWWMGIGYELRLTRAAGQGLRARSKLALLIATLVMLASAKYAVYIVAVQLLLALLTDRRRWMTYLLTLLAPLLVFEACMGGLFATGAVIKGDSIEGKGIQLQQIARVAQRDPSAIPAAARVNLAPIMDLDAAGFAYYPNDADRVKSSGNSSKVVVYRWRTVTAGDMKDFNRAWAQIGRQAPTIYLDAFLAKCYGYFDLTDHAYVPMAYYVSNGYVQQDSAWIKYWCHGWRDRVAWFACVWTSTPILGWPASGNFWVVSSLLLLAYEAARGRWRDILGQVPLILLMGVMIAAPANNFERHMLPLVFTLPFLVIAARRAQPGPSHSPSGR
ncbi:hypothetical protein AB656_04910 [Bifidobacterium actinocoloniiforme DSM 22766]|nr:hypothetical protein AB656_04910 [Bifidobacterium actinocoloniiforme DSM 22766]